TVESLEGEAAKNAVYAFLKEDAHHEVIDRDGRIGLVLTWQHKGTTYRGTPYDKGRPLGTEIPKELYEQGITQKHGVDGFFPLVKTFYVETLRTLFQEKKDARPPIPEAERYQASLDWCQKHLSEKSHVVFVRGDVAVKVISDDTVQFFVD
ncbi:MAG: hypothetical protein GW939_00185, partial [Candidatus Magasanikbacteria bacterium]|nr:hypothetical protein [Candidatus Magasanikbacteria bacterium]